ncbi:SIR2 family protein [Mesorhizobium sp. B2-1-8]|uniref:SIR2 family NAD-dependent protein deacylase n=1 Tax=Mesorhizobium sp. B2-1-8 TaxID=2589967 RepID=UPI00112E16DB|nr:SIR2 family protein [Mesorhizobium sp. B2-1-8]UCI21578.1 SIR2 family protein [Mesorhizobium sp. B2-1-8]
MEIETAVRFISIGKATLFLGAGFSSELVAVDKEPVPSVKKLSEIFATKVGMSPSLPLDITAREYLRSPTASRVNEYVNLMRSNVKVLKYKEWHRKTLFSNWRSIYTTNYDDCVELVERDINIGLRPISPYSPFQFYDVQIPIVHLHGFIDDLNENDYRDALLLTREQYASYETNHKYWDFLQRDIETSSAIFFCGFSLSDWHIEKILSKSPYTKDKTFFILRKDSEDNEELKYRLAEYGNIYFGGIEEFSRLVPPYAERASEVAIPQFLRKISEITPIDIASSKAAEDVHFFGHHNLELAEFDRTSSSPVLLKREIQDSIVASIEEGKRFHLVHADRHCLFPNLMTLTKSMTDMGFGEIFKGGGLQKSKDMS